MTRVPRRDGRRQSRRALDDAELLRRVRDRDSTALERLYDRYHRLVYGIALRMLDDAATAEDVTQSVFITLWRVPDAFRGGSFGAWLSRVARNRSLDVLRVRAAHGHTEVPTDLPTEGSVEDDAFERLDSNRIRAALAMLPDEQRIPIETGFFGGVTHEEMAKRSGIPVGTIKTRIRAGLQRLREELER